MTWVDHALTEQEHPEVSVERNWPLPKSPLSPLPRAMDEEEQDPQHLEDHITGSRSGDEDEDEDEQHEEYDSHDENDENEEGDLKALILNNTGGGIIEVMSWLQEAIQTVNMLESRVQELEQDCSVRMTAL